MDRCASMMTEAAVTARIQMALGSVEREQEVVILLAVESGSRAWGFASADSDYDVRFIYVRRPEWYLSIDSEQRRDVIERPIDDVLDVSGWDLRKALRLFHKSNPPLLEWLQCPIIYREQFTLAERLRASLPRFFQPNASYHHYLHMARGNYRSYLQGEIVWRKKYFYVLRPLLAILWLEGGRGPVPIEFGRLVDATIDDPGLRSAIDALVNAKRRGAELDRGPRDSVISDFLESQLSRLESGEGLPRGTSAPGLEELNTTFRETLREVWHSP
jgi:predicted nucleotidyltransferase